MLASVTSAKRRIRHPRGPAIYLALSDRGKPTPSRTLYLVNSVQDFRSNLNAGKIPQL